MRLPKAINTIWCALLLVFIVQSDAHPFSWSQTELHHIFPQAYAGWFRQRDIEPNLWCIPLSREKHTGALTGIHHKKYAISGGQDFNGSWRFFIEKNPNASNAQCFAFATMLLAEFGINLRSQTFYDYTTKQASSVKIPKNKLIEKSSRFVSKYMKFGGRLIRLTPFLIVAWELYDLGSSFDISLDEEKFDKGIDAYVRGQELYAEGEAEEARAQFLIANYELGSMFHKEIMERTTNIYKEVTSKFKTERQIEAFNLCMYFLKNAYKIKEELKILFPQIPLYIGEIMALNGENKKAVPYLKEAASEFTQIGKASIAEHIGKLISKIN